MQRSRASPLFPLRHAKALVSQHEHSGILHQYNTICIPYLSLVYTISAGKDDGFPLPTKIHVLYSESSATFRTHSRRSQDTSTSPPRTLGPSRPPLRPARSGPSFFAQTPSFLCPEPPLSLHRTPTFFAQDPLLLCPDPLFPCQDPSPIFAQTPLLPLIA